MSNEIHYELENLRTKTKVMGKVADDLQGLADVPLNKVLHLLQSMTPNSMEADVAQSVVLLQSARLKLLAEVALAKAMTHEIEKSVKAIKKSVKKSEEVAR